MKQLIFGLAAAFSLAATADTAYPADPAIRAENQKRVQAFREKASRYFGAAEGCPFKPERVRISTP